MWTHFLFPHFQIQDPTHLQQAARLRKQLGLSFPADCLCLMVKYKRPSVSACLWCIILDLKWDWQDVKKEKQLLLKKKRIFQQGRGLLYSRNKGKKISKTCFKKGARKEQRVCLCVPGEDFGFRLYTLHVHTPGNPWGTGQIINHVTSVQPLSPSFPPSSFKSFHMLMSPTHNFCFKALLCVNVATVDNLLAKMLTYVQENSG